MAHTPPITCRATTPGHGTTTHHCNHKAVSYTLYSCDQTHIQEIALCDKHLNYKNIYSKLCPQCGRNIYESITKPITQISLKHLTEYIYHTRRTPTGGTILPED